MESYSISLLVKITAHEIEAPDKEEAARMVLEMIGDGMDSQWPLTKVSLQP